MRVLETKKEIVTSPYGPRGNSFHKGVDLVGEGYTLDGIVAHSAGTVVACRNSIKGFVAGSYGNYVKIDHGNGYETFYAHMAYKSVAVKVGDKVSQGQHIGEMGNTGASYGAHLHFEVRENGKQIDPTDYAFGKDLPSTEIKDLDTISNEVIAGLWGNQPERQKRLEAAGYNYEEVRAEVNRKLGVGTEIKEGDIVIVNGVGTSGSDGSGNVTRNYVDRRMKVIAINHIAKNGYACNQYAEGNVKDYSKVTAWFSKDSLRKA